MVWHLDQMGVQHEGLRGATLTLLRARPSGSRVFRADGLVQAQSVYAEVLVYDRDGYVYEFTQGVSVGENLFEPQPVTPD